MQLKCDTEVTKLRLFTLLEHRHVERPSKCTSLQQGQLPVTLTSPTGVGKEQAQHIHSLQLQHFLPPLVSQQAQTRWLHCCQPHTCKPCGVCCLFSSSALSTDVQHLKLPGLCFSFHAVASVVAAKLWRKSINSSEARNVHAFSLSKIMANKSFSLHSVGLAVRILEGKKTI